LSEESLHLIRRADALCPRYRSHFRLVDQRDADFIVKLRGDENLSRHLSASTTDTGAQREWIRGYKERERKGREFYFVIVSDHADRGVIRMYDFRDMHGQSSFCWGSWIIGKPRPSGLVTFSAIMIYEIGFDTLGFGHAHFDVRKANSAVIAFHERAGARKVGEDAENMYFSYTPDEYSNFRSSSSRQINEHRRPTR
jgi:RimJ/RimL family protein N-acetyltransferase